MNVDVQVESLVSVLLGIYLGLKLFGHTLILYLTPPLFLIEFIYLLAALSLCCCEQGFSSWGDWGLPSSCGTQAS